MLFLGLSEQRQGLVEIAGFPAQESLVDIADSEHVRVVLLLVVREGQRPFEQ
ncbi:MAG: hypothetical protein ACRERU_05120 [Methylococcales bacterium]